MRIFVTGATGWVGSAVIEDLIAHGHQVAGLARSAASAEKLSATGAQVVRGSIEEIEVLRAASAQADAVIHTAFNHERTRAILDWTPKQPGLLEDLAQPDYFGS